MIVKCVYIAQLFKLNHRLSRSDGATTTTVTSGFKTGPGSRWEACSRYMERLCCRLCKLILYFTGREWRETRHWHNSCITAPTVLSIICYILPSVVWDTWSLGLRLLGLTLITRTVDAITNTRWDCCTNWIVQHVTSLAAAGPHVYAASCMQITWSHIAFTNSQIYSSHLSTLNTQWMSDMIGYRAPARPWFIHVNFDLRTVRLLVSLATCYLIVLVTRDSPRLIEDEWKALPRWLHLIWLYVHLSLSLCVEESITAPTELTWSWHCVVWT